MDSCRNLKQGDKCDICGEGIMRPTGRRFVLHKKLMMNINLHRI
jgi:ribosomal protein S27E